MTTISIDDVKKLARLSALSVSDEEAAALAVQLQDILGYVAQLDEVDTAGVEPTYQVTGLVNVTRADEIIDYGVDADQLLALAPATQDNQIKVPRVLA
jgi:aspartyl-tRNA(Asn)/glutamyl-tRNA(Gln) amidotransferase subunit C